MKDYYLFGDNDSSLKISEQLGLMKVTQIEERVPLFKPEELVFQLERLITYLKTYSVKEKDGRKTR